MYKEAYGDRVHLSNLNDLLLQAIAMGKGYYNYPKGSRVEQPAPELDHLDAYLAKTRQASSLIPHGKLAKLIECWMRMWWLAWDFQPTGVEWCSGVILWAWIAFTQS